MRTICIAGKNEIAIRALDYLLEEFPNHTYCVITNKTDDGINNWQPSLKKHATFKQVPQVKLPDVYPIQDLLFLSLEFDSIIKLGLFKSPHLFNIHFSALPKYKGMFTSIHPLLNGEFESGVTLHKIDDGIDTGDIIDQAIFPISIQQNSRELYQDYLDNAFDLFKKHINSLVTNTAQSSPQPAVGSDYYSKRSIDFKDIRIDLNKTAFEIHNQFRAFAFREYQLPVFASWQIYRSEITDIRSHAKPGTVIDENDGHFIIASIDYNVKLFKDYYDQLWDACTNGAYGKVESSLKFIPDINKRNKQGWNALILAVYNNQKNIVEYLLKNKADVNATNFKGTTIAMYAFSCYEKTSDISMLKFILSFYPNLYLKDDRGKPIFEYCKNYPEVLALLNGNKSGL